MRRLGPAVLVVALCVLGAVGARPAAGSAPPPGSATRLQHYASATWRSFTAMVDTPSGLPTDQLHADGTTDVQTSTTNIGAYMWSAVAAQRLGVIDHAELVARLSATITTLEHMERHWPDGQFYNWYDHRDGSKLTTWPPSGDPLDPILSSVDNAWLATGLRIVAYSVPELRSRAKAIYDSMDFGFYYEPSVNRILFDYSPAKNFRNCCYDTVVSESRIADYIGVSKGELPRKEYYGRWRSFPDTCDWSWQETRPSGFDRTYDGVSVYDGAYPYHDTMITPGWGGSMFEELMPSLFVPEESWGAASWRMNHPVTVDAQIDHGLNVAGYGAWGFSPSNTPEGGYNAYGVDAIGMNPTGYPSNEDNTLVDHGFAGCPDRDPTPDPPQSAYTNGVVTPHAAFLALRYRPTQALADLRRLQSIPDMYGNWGFRDSVNMTTLDVSDGYLSLDQGIIMAALGNALGGDVMRTDFATPDFRAAVRPVLGVEEFATSPRGCTITGTDGPDTLVGTPGPDVICGLGGDDVIRGAGGDDVIYGDAGNDHLMGGGGNDYLYGDDGNDVLSGAGGADVLAGGPGADRLSGDAGADHLDGQGGGDTCIGDARDDLPADC
ncbi:MAG TPA: glucoamylase family protein [Jatrophihabitans sp.]|nr:glucoamylase family protein [Jatrophihabitans sp.]